MLRERGEEGALMNIGFALSLHWFDSCDLLRDGTRREYRPGILQPSTRRWLRVLNPRRDTPWQ